MKVYVQSLGCKVNLADAAAVVAEFAPYGLQLTDDLAEAQVLLLNTCTVTHKADRDVRKILGSLAREHADLPVVVTGCASRVHRERLAGFANVTDVLAPGQPREIARRLAELGGAPAESASLEGLAGSPSPFFRMGRSRAFAKVQDGCDAHCKYCIIPTVRGRQRSLPISEAISAIEALVQAGHGEIVLCGIHLGRWGSDLPEGGDLADLLEGLDRLFDGGKARLRISSVEPLEWTDKLLGRVAERPWICRHFHVPVQSLADGVLRAMGRPYRAQQALDVLDGMRQRFPHALLGTDLLVGFPGESDEQAEATLEALRTSPLEHLHVFTYSARPGTVAAQLPGQLDAQVVRGRAKLLRELGDGRWQAFMERGLGQEHQVLVESGGAGHFRGHSEHYRPMRLRADEPGGLKLGSLQWVRAEKLAGQQLEGVVSSSTQS